MRIQDDEAHQQDVNLSELLYQFQRDWRNVFVTRIGDQDFIYRSLGRKEFRDILNSEEMNDYLKEEVICEVCVLYPEDYAWDECEAGLPTKLSEKILHDSFLDGFDSYHKILNFYRQDMAELDNQVTAVINEAFPNLDLEEIESWDMEKTMKYFSRAEWSLHNLRGVPFNEEAFKETYINEHPEVAQAAQEKEEQSKPQAKKNDSDKTIRGGSRKNKLTPEKLRQLQEQFPEIDWTHDNGAEGFDGMAQPEVDTVAPALRPGW